jgi:hypothetical protein
VLRIGVQYNLWVGGGGDCLCKKGECMMGGIMQASLCGGGDAG